MSHVATYMWTESNKAFCIDKESISDNFEFMGIPLLRDNPFILQVCKKGL